MQARVSELDLCYLNGVLRAWGCGKLLLLHYNWVLHHPAAAAHMLAALVDDAATGGGLGARLAEGLAAAVGAHAKRSALMGRGPGAQGARAAESTSSEDRGGDRNVSTGGRVRGDHGPSRGTDPGTDHGTDHGNDLGTDHGTDHGSNIEQARAAPRESLRAELAPRLAGDSPAVAPGKADRVGRAAKRGRRGRGGRRDGDGDGRGASSVIGEVRRMLANSEEATAEAATAEAAAAYHPYAALAAMRWCRKRGLAGTPTCLDGARAYLDAFFATRAPLFATLAGREPF